MDGGFSGGDNGWGGGLSNFDMNGNGKFDPADGEIWDDVESTNAGSQNYSRNSRLSVDEKFRISMQFFIWSCIFAGIVFFLCSLV